MAEGRAVVVGAGGISSEWFKALAAEKVDVSAIVVRSNVEAARKRVEPYEFDCELSTDLVATLKKHRPDFVVDLTEPAAHCGVTCAALESGAHVLGEKPMAPTLDEARTMVKAAEQSGRMYMVSQSARWSAENAAMRKAIMDGAIGKVTFLSCDWHLAVHLEDFRKTMKSPLLIEGAIHQFDLARFLTGAEPESVCGREFNPSGSWFDGDAAASCIFEMAGGIVFAYSGSFCSEGCFSSGLGQWRIIGEKGTICLDSDQKPRGQTPAGTGEIMWPQKEIDIPAVEVSKPRMHGALDEMLEFTRSGRTPQTECHDNIRSMAMVCAVSESSNKNARVAVTT